MTSFLVRRIKEVDFENGFFETLSNLTTVGDIRTNEDRRKIINRILGDPNYIIIVAEEQENQTIIGTATLLIEQKFIHNGGKVGHIEDVATRAGYEGIGVGKEIIQRLIEISKDQQCYKIILDCDDKVIGFYEKLGFKKRGVMMRLDI